MVLGSPSLLMMNPGAMSVTMPAEAPTVTVTTTRLFEAPRSDRSQKRNVSRMPKH